MSKKISGVAGKTLPKISRRKRVIEMLTKQLKAGTKTLKGEFPWDVVPLTEKDITRINKEIETLKTRI